MAHLDEAVLLKTRSRKVCMPWHSFRQHIQPTYLQDDRSPGTGQRQHRCEIQVVSEHRIAMGSRALHQGRRPSAAGSMRSTLSLVSDRSCRPEGWPSAQDQRLFPLLRAPGGVSQTLIDDDMPTVMLGLMPGNGKGKRSGASITTRATATHRRLHRIPLGQGLAKRLVTSAIGRSALPQP